MAGTPHSPGRIPPLMISPSSSVSPGKGMGPDSITFLPFYLAPCGSFFKLQQHICSDFSSTKQLGENHV